MKLETVKVKASNKEGFRVINARDFDPKKHTEYKQGKAQGKQAE